MNYDPEAMRGQFSAQKLAILEKFMGDDFTMFLNGNETGDVYGSEAVQNLTDAYDTLKNHVFTNIAVQTVLADKFEDAEYNILTDSIVFPEGEDLVSYFADIINTSTYEENIFIGIVIDSLVENTGVTFES